MKLLLIRHAPAADRANYAPKGIDDSLRPLTDSGREKMVRDRGRPQENGPDDRHGRLESSRSRV